MFKREGIDEPTKYGTMYDGGEDEDVDDDVDGDGDGEDDQEYLEVLGNKYSLDEEGRNKLIEDVKGIERAYGDSKRESQKLQELLDSSDVKPNEGDEDGDKLPFDMDKFSPEDQEAIGILQQLIDTQTEAQIEKVMKPFIEQFVDKQIDDELQEIKNVYGDFDEQKLLDFADENRIDDLMSAYKAMNFDSRYEAGRKAEASDRERKRNAFIPEGKGGKGSKVPKYDRSKHKNMGIREFLEKYVY